MRAVNRSAGRRVAASLAVLVCGALVASCSAAPGGEAAAGVGRDGAVAVAPSVETSPLVTPVRTSAAARPPFTASGRKAKRADVPLSWRPGCPVGPKQLRVLSLTYWGFDRKAHTGELVVHKAIAKPTRRAFRDLYRYRFPVRSMRPVDEFGAKDRRSMKADNTSAFNCRTVGGTSRWSNHAYGRAIDINPVENPYVQGSYVSPKAGRAYVDRSDLTRGMIGPRSRARKAFTSRGFQWGGFWSATPDYQHFDRA
jgi:hypothetical protein